MSTGARLLSQPFPRIRNIYDFNSDLTLFKLFSSPSVFDCWLGCCQTATVRWSEIPEWWGCPRWIDNIANGLALGSPRHSLSIQFSSISPLASFHLTERAAVCLSWEPANHLLIILCPGRLLHIPFGPPSSRSTELPLIVTGPIVHCITASQLPFFVQIAAGQWLQR